MSSPPDSHGDSRAVGELLDKQALYENMALYCRGQDRKQLDLMKSTFWSEATDNHGVFNGSAHEFCEWSYENHKTTQHRAQHYITNVLVDLDGDRARRETAFIYVMVKPGDQKNMVMGGRYRDLCERRDGSWKVLRRVVVFDHVGQFTDTTTLASVFGGAPETTRVGDVYPDDPIYELEW